MKNIKSELKTLIETLRDLAAEARDDSDSIEEALAAEEAYFTAAELVEELHNKFSQ